MTIEGKYWEEMKKQMEIEIGQDKTKREVFRWLYCQELFKYLELKDANGIFELMHQKSLDTGHYGFVNETYLGFENCPVCNKKVDVMMWDGEKFYLEIDLRKDRSSPIHWCELTRESGIYAE